MTMNQKMLPYGASPVNVVDISAVLQMEQIIDDNLDKLRAPHMKGMNPPPPLDTITTTTDENDSVASLSTGSPDQDEDIDGSSRSLPASFATIAAPKRSIFSGYWDKTGDKPVKPQSFNRALLHQRRQRVVVASSHENTENKSYFPQEPSVQDIEDSSSTSSSDCSSPRSSDSARSPCHPSQDSPVSPRTRRRSIFGSKPIQLDSSTRSLPTLAMNNEFEAVVRSSAAPSPLGRKACSSSALEGKRLPSCLRSRRQRQSSSTSVSFDEKIDVVIFQKPQEQFSEFGWEQLFTA